MHSKKKFGEEAAFDVASRFGLSFGIAKFQLAQVEVKLVGELVGREGRKPNPDMIRCIKLWPPVKTLKDLQSFLGTMNFIRPHMPPNTAHIMHPLRALLKPGAAFPPTEEQQKAIQLIKDAASEHAILYVPNEEAAILAAASWNKGERKAGLPFEAGADTSKIAMGGAMGQCEYDGGPLRILLLWSAPLSPSQSQYHPFEQELLGCLQLNRQIVIHFGRIPKIFHTDHATIVRLSQLPLNRIEAKHYRWYAEITQDGTLLIYQPGTSPRHRLYDGLSRNPPMRDLLNLARIEDWSKLRSVIKGLESDIDA